RSGRDTPPQAEGDADSGMLSMTERPNGTAQVTSLAALLLRHGPGRAPPPARMTSGASGTCCCPTARRSRGDLRPSLKSGPPPGPGGGFRAPARGALPAHRVAGLEQYPIRAIHV